jgi:hypothetical protein
MSRTVSGVVLLALVLSLPLVHITPVHCSSGETLAALDVCSTHTQANTSDLSILTEPFFDVSVFQAPAGYPETIVYMLEFMFSSRIDRPPRT